ncbi:MAG: hypothetical protein ACYTGN_06710 [Planctomycetota bacterium]|jgi:hypothetical protein
MRRWLPLLFLTPFLVAGEKSMLEVAVERFSSQHLAVRDQGSRDASREVRRLLKPLLVALEHSDPEVRRRARAALRMELPLIADVPAVGRDISGYVIERGAHARCARCRPPSSSLRSS